VPTESEEPYVVIDQERSILGEQNGHPGVSPLTAGAYRSVGESEVSVVVAPDLVTERLLFNPVVDGIEVALSNADDFHAEGIELGFEVTEPATFDGSPVGPGGWKEPQDRRAPRNIGGTS